MAKVDNKNRIVYIYKVTSPSGRIYVGSTLNYKRRLRDYRNLNCKTQIKLLYSFEKYSVDNHIFDIVEECSFEMRNIRESFWGMTFNVLGEEGLNCVLPKSEIYQGISEDTRQKHRDLPRSEEVLQRLRTNFLGRKHTPESIEKCRVSKLGNPSFTGKKHKPETLLKMSKAQKGKIISNESKEKRRQTLASRSPTEKEINSRLNNPSSKLVLNLETGIYYNSVKEAQRYSTYPRNILQSMLSGQQINKSSYILV